MDLLLRASNEGLLRPRVARAQKIIRLHPLPFIVRVLRARRIVWQLPIPLDRGTLPLAMIPAT